MPTPSCWKLPISTKTASLRSTYLSPVRAGAKSKCGRAATDESGHHRCVFHLLPEDEEKSLRFLHITIVERVVLDFSLHQLVPLKDYLSRGEWLPISSRGSGSSVSEQ